MITYYPKEMLREIAPRKELEKLVGKSLSITQAVSKRLARSGFLSKKNIDEIALRVIKSYKERIAEEIDSGALKKDAVEEVVNDNALVVQRVENAFVSEIAKDIKDSYLGERYRWLPSDAAVPDPLHQLNYGKVFTIGEGEMPGDRYGCQCGMEILVSDSELDLS